MTPIEKVYEQYKHMDQSFMDNRWRGFRQKIIADLWQAIRQTVEEANNAKLPKL